MLDDIDSNTINLDIEENEEVLKMSELIFIETRGLEADYSASIKEHSQKKA